MNKKHKQAGFGHVATAALAIVVVAVIAFAGTRIINQSSAYYVSDLGNFGCKTTATLRKGVRSPACVKALQYGLNNWIRYHNYNISFLSVDGDFGAKTEAVVKQYQSKKGLKPVDGIVGPDTWRVFLKDCSVFKACVSAK